MSNLFVSEYNGQQHFTYRDGNGNLQDCWIRDGPGVPADQAAGRPC